MAKKKVVKEAETVNGLPVNVDIALGRHRHFIEDGAGATKEDGVHRHIYVINERFFVTELSGEHSHEVVGDVAQNGGEHSHMLKIEDDEMETDISAAHSHKEIIRGVFTSVSGDHEHEFELLDGTKVSSLLVSKVLDEKIRKSMNLGVNIIILDKERFHTFEQAAKWMDKHGFLVGAHSETKHSFQFEQISRDLFNEASLKTVHLVDGVNITLGILDSENPLEPTEVKDENERPEEKPAEEETSEENKEKEGKPAEEGAGQNKESTGEEKEKSEGSEVGIHYHHLNRAEKLTEKDGAHSHLFALKDGRVIATKTGGEHRHALDSVAGNSADYQMSTHIHEVVIDGDSFYTREDGEHGHAALMDKTSEDGSHTHTLEFSGEEIRSLNSGELWYLKNKNPKTPAKVESTPVEVALYEPPTSNVDVRIEDVIGKAFSGGDVYFRKDWGGISVDLVKTGDDVSIFYSETKIDVSQGFSSFCNRFSGVPVDFSIRGSVGVRKEGGGVLTRASLFKIETDLGKNEDDYDYFIELNDALVIDTNIEELSYETRHKKLTEFYSENLPDDDDFEVCELKKVEHEGSFFDLVEEGFKSREVCGFFLQKDKGVYQYLKSPVVKVQVTGSVVKEDGSFIYECGALAEDGIVLVGKTFSTGIVAEEGDILTVELLELSEGGAWSAARVVDVDYIAKSPATVQSIEATAKSRGVFVEKQTEDLVEIAVKYVNLWKEDVKRARKYKKPDKKEAPIHKNKSSGKDLPLKTDLSKTVQKLIKTARPGSFKIVEEQGVKKILLGDSLVCLLSQEVSKAEFGSYEIGVATDRNLEFFLKGIKLKGRFTLDLNRTKDGTDLLLEKSEDNIPLFDREEISCAIAKASNGNSKWLRWSKPGLRPRVVEVEKFSVKKQFNVPIQKIDDERQIVFGVVLEPDSVDAQGDKISSEEIEKAAHKFMVKSRVIGEGHSKTTKAEPVESYIAPSDFKLGEESIKKGSWVLGVHVPDAGLWAKIKNGELNSYSIGGFGIRE